MSVVLVKMVGRIQMLTISDFRTYIYVRYPKTVATPVRIYICTQTLRSKCGALPASNRHFTVSTHEGGVHVLPVCGIH